MSKFAVKKQEEKHSEIPESMPHQWDPVNTVESVITKALKTSASKMGLGKVNAVVSRIKGGDSVAFSYYNYHVVKEMAEVLGSFNKDIRAVYAHDYEGVTPEEACVEDASPSSLIHMIIWAQRKTKALDALLDAVDRAMTEHHRHMLGLSKLEHVLDAQVIDDEDVQSRRGYAVLLKSVYQPPFQVWRSGLDVGRKR